MSIRHHFDTPPSERALTIEVRDDGRGIQKRPGPDDSGDSPQDRSTLGIPGMRERVDLLNGVMDIDSSNDGTTIRFRIPFENRTTESCK